MTIRLPVGFEVRLGRQVRVLAGGRTLVGGSPGTGVTLRRPLVDGVLRVVDAPSSALANRLLDLGIVDPVVTTMSSVATGEITVVVPVRDRPAALRRALGSIGAGPRVIVVDDCSEDADAIAGVAAAAGAGLIRLETNLGPAAARNIGLSRVETPYVAFVDSDVELSPGVLERLGRHFADPNVVLVGPRIRGRQVAEGGSVFAAYDAERSALDLGPCPGSVRPGSTVSYLPGACLLGRTDRLGTGFDPAMRVGEDVDLVWRLAASDARIRYDPSVQVFHEARASAYQVLGRRFAYGTSAAALARRHGAAVAPAVLVPWSTAVLVALLAQRCWSVPVAATLTGLAAVRLSGRLAAPDSLPTALALTSRGVAAAGRQASGLALRHWWPLAVLGAATSKRFRRALLVAAAVDAVTDRRHMIARRLDDVAYGAGVWVGAWHARSPRALLPARR